MRVLVTLGTKVRNTQMVHQVIKVKALIGRITTEWVKDYHEIDSGI